MTSEFREYCEGRSIKAEAPGNTGRSFLVTCYDVDHVMDVINAVKNKYTTLTYIIACREICPTTGRPHNHIYAHFRKSITLSGFMKIVRPHHVDKCRGTPKECITYVKKDGNIILEEGVEPHQGKQLTETDLTSMSVLEIVGTDPRCHQAYLKARDILLNGPLTSSNVTNRKKVEIYYIYGPSGCGKSLMASYLLKEHMEETGALCDRVKFKNDFWINIYGSECAWYDEFRDSHMKPDEFISFVDYRKQPMNVKGSSTQNGYTFIVITSVQGPDEIYRNVTSEPRAQWLRRIKWINLGWASMQRALNVEKYKMMDD